MISCLQLFFWQTSLPSTGLELKTKSNSDLRGFFYIKNGRYWAQAFNDNLKLQVFIVIVNNREINYTCKQ